MADQNDVVKCPFCHGHGELRRAEIVARLTESNLPQQIQDYLAEIGKPMGNCGESAPNSAKPRNFFQEVHSWNPKLPIWRRSPKE